jgi:hypothetical protein
MPAYATNAVVEKQIDLVTWVGNDAQVDLTVETGIYLTQKQGVRNIQYINPDTTGFASLLEYDLVEGMSDTEVVIFCYVQGEEMLTRIAELERLGNSVKIVPLEAIDEAEEVYDREKA